ncbi:MAG: RNA-binding S4 domain-containing protein [Acidobacteriota bacterium]
MTDRAGSTPIRLDVWLDVACLCKTRSEAQHACRLGKIEVNGQAAKPHRVVKPGDQIRISRPTGRKQMVVVTALADTHMPKAQARTLYEDRTPPPTPEERAASEMERQYSRFRRLVAPGSPTLRERRRLRREKEGEPR